MGPTKSITVSVTGLSTTAALGTETVEADSLVTLVHQTTTALGTATGEPEHVVSVTGVSSQFNLGSTSIEEGAGVTLGSLSTSFGEALKVHQEQLMQVGVVALGDLLPGMKT